LFDRHNGDIASGTKRTMTSTLKQEYKTVTYPLLFDDETEEGTLLLFGRPTASRILFMCAGFPDNHSCLISLARRFALAGNFVGVTCLPGLCKIRKLEGFTFDEWVYSTREALKKLRAHSRRPSASLTFVCHGWACLAGQMLTTRLLKDGFEDLIPNELVLLDVCMPPHPSVDTSSLDYPYSFIEALYTWLSIAAFTVNWAIAYLVFYYSSPDICVFFFLAGWKLQMWLDLSPLLPFGPDFDQICNRFSTKNQHLLMYSAYPNYYFLKTLLLRTGQLDTCHLPMDLTKTPILYLFGADKNVQFHSARTIAVLEEEFMSCRRSKAVSVANAGHWLHLQKEDVVYHEITKFLTNDCIRFQPFQ
jgi:pimeloyl-ACP methyl ester carboxylesterase